MRPAFAPATLAILLSVLQPASAKDESKQAQIDSNTARIESLEAKTTLGDLSCATDEVAAFDGADWACTSPATLLTLYQARLPVSLESLPSLPLTVTWEAYCSLGDLAIGGGYETPVGSFSYRVVSSHRSVVSERAWSTDITVAPGTITLPGAVYATCLDRTP